MDFIADLHIHSKFSRATAKNADLENLHMAAQFKGITLLGTGDFTHPGWFDEIREKLVPAEPGLFRLKDDLAQQVDRFVPEPCRGPVRFIINAEISNIYKKDGRTRKNHNLIFVPDMDTAETFRKKLEQIGNIASDGRPILGLDARNLLELLLETDSRNFLIPAHIWTPWFSLLGSKSGFDTIEACFEDLSSHIFALETGLSSDPAMNWRVSSLDGRTLVSNSDAHSPSKLGREANRFCCNLSYDDVRTAMETGDPSRFLGTLEFYPEEGKYHLDGHRKCGICFHPKKTMNAGGICPVCQRPLTLGVLYRVEELADRSEDQKPPGTHPFTSVVPLVDILADIYRVGPASKKVAGAYEAALKALGSELDILTKLNTDDLEQAGIPLLSLAVERMRGGRIHVNGGFDGQYGTVKIFTDDERRSIMGQKSLFVMPQKKSPPETAAKVPDLPRPAEKLSEEGGTRPSRDLNPEQHRAVTHGRGPVMIIAGPGTGKTLTLTRRIAYLVNEKGISPQKVLAVTFTNKAAKEMTTRLNSLIPTDGDKPFVSTFHGLCLSLLKEKGIVDGHAIVDDADRKSLVADAMDLVLEEGNPAGGSIRTNLERIVQAKQLLLTHDSNLVEITPDAEKNGFKKVYGAYEALLSRQNLLDFEDLILKTVSLFNSDPDFTEGRIQRFSHVFVDEYQDLNYGQYRLIRALAPNPDSDIFVIGDPDQAIYGFRGSDVRYFSRFLADYPQPAVIRLMRNYRSTETILEAASQVICTRDEQGGQSRIYASANGGKRITIIEAENESGEAVVIGKTIETLVGGLGMHAMDFGKAGLSGEQDRFSFSDFAVLARTRSQLDAIAEQLASAGIPCQLAAKDKVFQQRGPAEIISFLKIISDRSIFSDIERIRTLVRPGISKETAGYFKRWCLKNQISLDRARFAVREFPVTGLTQKRQARLYDFLGALFTLQQALLPLPVIEKIRYLMDHTKVSETLTRFLRPGSGSIDGNGFPGRRRHGWIHGRYRSLQGSRRSGSRSGKGLFVDHCTGPRGWSFRWFSSPAAKTVSSPCLPIPGRSRMRRRSGGCFMWP